MGDLEQYELNALRRDGELDWYYDWLRDFAYKGEPRQNLVSWLTFTMRCPPCGRDETIVKVGEHSYEGYCEHVHDREEVDAMLAAIAAHEEYESRMYESELRTCTVHLISVPVIHAYRDWWDQRVWVEELACKCRLRQIERRPCPECPALSDGSMPSPVVLSYETVNRADPTVAYKLECGHVVIDM